MKQEFVLFLVICAFTAAMVPRDRRAVNTEESQPDTGVKICANLTPCGWSLYVPKTDRIQQTIMNNYCVCARGMDCVIAEDDRSVNAYVHRCRPPNQDNDNS